MDDWSDEFDGEGPATYEAMGADRPRLARAVRDTLITERLDGTDWVWRFMRGRRFRVRLPEGEDLLRHVTLMRVDTWGENIVLRATVALPCRPEGAHDVWPSDTYYDEVQFAFNPAEWDEPDDVLSYQREERRLQDIEKNVETKMDQVRTVIAIAIVSVAGFVAAELSTGVFSAAKQKIAGWYQRVIHPGATDERDSTVTVTSPRR